MKKILALNSIDSAAEISFLWKISSSTSSPPKHYHWQLIPTAIFLFTPLFQKNLREEWARKSGAGDGIQFLSAFYSTKCVLQCTGGADNGRQNHSQFLNKGSSTQRSVGIRLQKISRGAVVVNFGLSLVEK